MLFQMDGFITDIRNLSIQLHSGPVKGLGAYSFAFAFFLLWNKTWNYAVNKRVKTKQDTFHNLDSSKLPPFNLMTATPRYFRRSLFILPLTGQSAVE